LFLANSIGKQVDGFGDLWHASLRTCRWHQRATTLMRTGSQWPAKRGFSFIAYLAEDCTSCVMTVMVNQDDLAYEKDSG